VVDAQDPEGHECAVGEVGEVIVKSPAVMLFYWGRPEETARALHRAPHDGWMHTGDAGRVDALAEDLRVFCKTLIAGYKCPKSVEFVAALPFSAAGKVPKNQLREPCWAGRERRIA
jgi:long-chain acyl-CoA synthetase